MHGIIVLASPFKSLVKGVANVALLCSTLFLLACDSGSASGTDNTEIFETGSDDLIIAQPELLWTECASDRSLECASLLVPMDYRNPRRQQISIAIARTRFNNNANTDSIRTVFTNPGGPGASGIEFLSIFGEAARFPTEVQQNVQFVTFDPRGLGDSTPVSCNLDRLRALDHYALSVSDLQNNLNFQSRYASDCFDRHGSYLQLLGSLNVVRDMNEIRKALFLDSIDYLGFSYGTRLGGLYLQTYPQHSGRFVLDGSVSPQPELEPMFRSGMLVADANVTRMIESCRLVARGCNPTTVAEELLEKMEVIGTGEETNDLFFLSVFLQVASTQPGFEETLARALVDYLESDDSDDLINGLARVGRDSGVDEDTPAPGINTTAYTAVLCADDPNRPTLSSLSRSAARFNGDSDLLAETYFTTIGICAGWPAAVEPLPDIATNQAPVSLVIGGPTDAQTPLAFSQDMARAVGGQFLRSEHQGHTVAFRGANACTDSAVSNFLLNGTLPAVSVCEDDNSVIMADSWASAIPVLSPPVFQ